MDKLYLGLTDLKFGVFAKGSPFLIFRKPSQKLIILSLL